MPSITVQLDRAFRQAIRDAFDIDADPVVGPSQNEAFGDYQSNAAMGLAKQVSEKTGAKTNPRQVAQQIVEKLHLGELAQDSPAIAGPGFINVRVSPKWLADELARVGADSRLGIEPVAAPQTVVVDYSGPNIAKQMHVGHLRSTIIGDAIARTLAFRGDRVIRQNHLGDWGTQFGRVVLAMWYEAVFDRTGQHAVLDGLIARQQSAAQSLAQSGDKPAYAAAIDQIVAEIVPLHQSFIREDPEGNRYFLPYLQTGRLELEELERAYVFVSAITDHPTAASSKIVHPVHGERALAELPRLTTTFIQNPNLESNEQEKLAWDKARRVTLDACGDVYRRLGVQLAEPEIQDQPLERGESFYNDRLPGIVEGLRRVGIALESEGAVVVPVPGFETPLIIEKAGGGYLYGTTDLAAIRFRTQELGATRVVYFVDARQSQHFAQVFWTARKAGWADNATLEHAAFGTMLGADGKPFKTRSGDTVKLKDLLEEAEQRAAAIVSEKNSQLDDATRKSIAAAVGIGAIKYADLSKDRTSDYAFVWERMLSFDGNTAPYLQNAYVRVHGIFRKASSTGVDARIDYAALRFEAPQELSLAKHLLRLGDVIDAVAKELKPHHLCNYLYELANRFHVFFEHCPVIQSDEPTRRSRLALCELTGRTLAQGMDLLGIAHPEQM